MNSKLFGIAIAAAFVAGVAVQHWRQRKLRRWVRHLEKTLAACVLAGAVRRQQFEDYRHHVRRAVAHGIMPVGSRQERN